MKKGFTLGEVLIALAIIGVVAAMTLPALNNNLQQQQAGPALMKAINALEQANMTLMNDTNNRRLHGACNTTMAGLSNAYLGCIRNQLNSSLITNTANYYEYSRRQSDSFDNLQGIKMNSNVTYYTPDSASYGAGEEQTTYLIMSVDINGPEKGPNTIAHDVFSIAINSLTGNVFAFGSRNFDDDVFRMDGVRSGNVWSSNNNCTAASASNPDSCAGSIVDNGGRVIYPW